MGSEVPEQAPLPSGISIRSSASTTVSAARARPTPHAAIKNAALTGWARWRCVYAGRSTSFSRAARSASAARSALDLPQKRRPAVTDVQPEVQRDLVVARARRVQPSGHRAEAPAELRLDRHVHVFLVRREPQGTGRSFVVESPKAASQRARVSDRYDAGAREHGDMGRAADEVLADERAVVLE